jgi:putative transposase
VVTVNGRKHWLWRAVDQHGAVLDVLVRRPRNKTSAKQLMRELVKRHGRPRVIVTDELRSYAAANNELGLHVEHRQHKGLKNRAENSHRLTRVHEKVMRRFKSTRKLQRCASVHGQVSNLFIACRYNRTRSTNARRAPQPSRPGKGLRAPVWLRKANQREALDPAHDRRTRHRPSSAIISARSRKPSL